MLAPLTLARQSLLPRTCAQLALATLILAPLAAHAQQAPTKTPPTSPTPATPAPTTPPQKLTPALPSQAMSRSDPKIKDVRFTVALYGSEDANPTARSLNPDGSTARQMAAFRLPGGAHLGIPVLLRTSWCDMDFTRMDVRLALDGRESTLDAASTYRKNAPGCAAIVDIPVPASGQWGFNEIRARVNYQVQLWELDVDEATAARSTWPRSWESSLDAYLKADQFIRSDDPAIQACAQGATKGGVRSVSPFYAARNAVIAVLGSWKSMSGGTSENGPNNTLRGMRLSSDGVYGIGPQRGTPVELAVTCVAAVRAIGIPARVVYCLVEQSQGSSGAQAEFRYIGEFYLKDVGWVPFDPLEMRGQGAATRVTQGPVKGFANVTDLEDALPIAFDPVPQGFSKADRIAGWGWDASGAVVDINYAISRMAMEFTGRGNGKVPTMPAPASDDGF